MLSASLSTSLLLITSGTLFWVAITDFRHFKIRNELIFVLIGLFVLYSFVSGRWVEIHWHVAIALLALIFMLYAYSQKLMGGGDVKLLAVAFLWTGPMFALPFVILLTIFICIHALATKFGWALVQRSEKGPMIPLAPSVAAALIGTFIIDVAHIWSFPG